MKGVFPSLGPKALMRNKQDTQSFSLFNFIIFVYFLEDGVVPSVARSVCVVTMHSEKKVLCGFVFLNSPPWGLNETNVETFPLSREKIPQNLSCFWNWREGAGQTVCQMQLICFWVMKWYISFPHIEWLWRWSLRFCFIFIYFWHLNWGKEFYTPSYQYLKAVFSFLSSHLECPPVFYSEAALLI